MTRVTELTPLLKCLKLSVMLDTLPERIPMARRAQLDIVVVQRKCPPKCSGKVSVGMVLSY